MPIFRRLNVLWYSGALCHCRMWKINKDIILEGEKLDRTSSSICISKVSGLWLERWQEAVCQCGDKQEQDKGVGLIQRCWHGNSARLWDIWSWQGIRSSGRGSRRLGELEKGEGGSEIQDRNPALTLPPLPLHSPLAAEQGQCEDWTYSTLKLEYLLQAQIV